MRKVLIPFDGSAASRRALQYAVDFAKEYGRLEIHLLKVQEEPVVYGDYLTASLLESLRQAALRAASHALEPAVEVLTQAEGARFILKDSHWYSMKVKGPQQLVPQTEEDIHEIKCVKKAELAEYMKISYPSVADVLKLVAE